MYYLKDIGKVGRILEVYDDRDLMVQFSPNMWALNPAICTKLSGKPHVVVCLSISMTHCYNVPVHTNLNKLK